ncbi:hypothetical protein LJC49_09780 [Ruminococcaceae bacterium OttesenSCG-928-I18]|nr:hypothetical protein [Ruminococcaceae bacterium OttesenSCG-928-I18]
MQKTFLGKNLAQAVQWFTYIFSTLDPEKEYDIEVKEHKNRRSLDANAYAWVLINALAVNMSLPPEEVYRNAIRNIGGNSDLLLIPNMAIDRHTRSWAHKGIGWQTELVGPSKEHEGYSWIKCIYGSSVYDTKQMSLLIDSLVQDAQAIGIETKTPDELAKMKSAWDEKYIAKSA